MAAVFTDLSPAKNPPIQVAPNRWLCPYCRAPKGHTEKRGVVQHFGSCPALQQSATQQYRQLRADQQTIQQLTGRLGRRDTTIKELQEENDRLTRRLGRRNTTIKELQEENDRLTRRLDRTIKELDQQIRKLQTQQQRATADQPTAPTPQRATAEQTTAPTPQRATAEQPTVPTPQRATAEQTTVPTPERATAEQPTTNAKEPNEEGSLQTGDRRRGLSNNDDQAAAVTPRSGAANETE